MDEATYLKERVDDQASWYDRKCIKYKKQFYFLRTIEIIAAALIPFIAIFKYDIVIYVTSGLGVAIVIVSGIMALKKYQENWLQYRLTRENLVREKFLYQAGTDPYNDINRFNIFVRRIEDILSAENVSWYQNMNTKNQQQTAQSQNATTTSSSTTSTTAPPTTQTPP
jgi:hypothetical protein